MCTEYVHDCGHTFTVCMRLKTVSSQQGCQQYNVPAVESKDNRRKVTLNVPYFHKKVLTREEWWLIMLGSMRGAHLNSLCCWSWCPASACGFLLPFAFICLSLKISNLFFFFLFQHFQILCSFHIFWKFALSENQILSQWTTKNDSLSACSVLSPVLLHPAGSLCLEILSLTPEPWFLSQGGELFEIQAITRCSHRDMVKMCYCLDAWTYKDSQLPACTAAPFHKRLTFISLKGDHCSATHWLHKLDSSMTVYKHDNKPVSSTRMKAGTLKALFCLSLHTWWNTSVTCWLRATSQCSGGLKYGRLVATQQAGEK